MQKEAEVISTLLHSGIYGLLIAPSKETYTYDHLKVLREKNIPLVFFDRHIEGFSASRVLINDHNGAYKAVTHLVATGRRRIAHVAGPPGLSNTIKRFSGHEDALNDHGISLDPALCLYCDLTKAHASRCTLNLLQLKAPPDAIFTYNSYIAFEGILTAKQAGLSIPSDIAFAGFASEPIISYIEPQLTAVIPPAYKLGQEAANLFLNQAGAKKKVVGPETIILEPEFVFRQST